MPATRYVNGLFQEAGKSGDAAGGEALREFQSRFREMFAGSSSVALAEGHLFMLSLAPIATALGKAWQGAASKAHPKVEALLRDNLARGDLFVRYDDVSYLIALPQLGMETATVRVLILARLVTDALVGSSGKVAVEVLRAVRGRGDDIRFEPLHSTSVRAGSEAAEAQGIGPGLPPDIDYLFRPLLTARTMVLSTYLCIPVRPRGDGSFASGYELAPSEALFPTLDKAVLARVVQELKRMEEEGAAGLLSLPVHYETLATASRRHEFARFASARLQGRRDSRLVFELVGLPDGIPQTQLIELVSTLKPHAKAVLARFSPQKQSFANLRDAGIHAVGMDVHYALESEEELFKLIERFVEGASAAGLKAYVHGIRALSLYTAAIAAGAEYVDGYALTSAVDSAMAARRYDFDAPFKAILDQPRAKERK